MESDHKKYLFEWIGAFSAISLVLMAAYVLAGALKGDFGIAAEFVRRHPGSEPFLIFILPIVLIIGPVWLWRRYRDWRSQRDLKR